MGTAFLYLLAASTPKAAVEDETRRSPYRCLRGGGHHSYEYMGHHDVREMERG